MSLQTANSYNALTWAQQQLNAGFTATYQGPDTFSYAKNFTVDPYGVSAVYAVEGSLSGSGSTTIDLQNLTDFFNEPLSFSRVYTLQIGVDGGDLLLTPAATNGFTWFLNSLSDGFVLKDGGNFMYNSTSFFTVSAGSSCITLTNQSATSLVYKLAIIGGTGPDVTPTPTPTVSPGPTALPTGTPVPSGTPVPTPPAPSPTYFVTPSPT